MEKIKFGEITEKIIGAAFEVHKFLGNACLAVRQGFQACLPKGSTDCRQELIYQRALAWEMSQVDLTFNREIEQDILFKDLREPIGTRRADFVAVGKAIKELEDVHLAQVLNYLKAYQMKVALLTNFGSKSLQFKRLVL